jgi:hypothetical protein
MTSILLELANKYTEEREKQSYLRGSIKTTYGIYKLYSIYVHDMYEYTVSFFLRLTIRFYILIFQPPVNFIFVKITKPSTVFILNNNII